MTDPARRVAIAGLGAIARVVYLPLLTRRCDLFRVTALCDLSEGLLATTGERLGVSADRRFTEFGRLLEAGDLDAVIVLTSGSHAAAAQQAVAADLPVLVEKPLGYTLADIDALGGSDLVQLGYMKLFDPAVCRAVELLAQRPAPRAVDVTVLHPAMEHQLDHLPASPPVPAQPAELLARSRTAVADQRARALGSEAAATFGALYTDVLLGSIVHNLYVVRALAGDPLAIDWAAAWPPGVEPASVEFTGRLQGQGRLSVRWHYLDRYPAYREEVRVHDDEGSIELVFPSPYLLNAPTELRITSRAGGAEKMTSVRSTREAFEEQLLAFHRRVLQGGPPEVTVDQGRQDVVTCQRIIRALAERRGIPIAGEAARA